MVAYNQELRYDSAVPIEGRCGVGTRRFWTADEDRRGADMVRDRTPLAVVAERLGRSLRSVQTRNSEVWKVHATRWSDEEEAVLVEMWRDGDSIENISERLGRGVEGVRFRKARLGFDRRGRKHPPANVAFFREWSEKSAYVYGLLVTDGCVHERPWTTPPTRKVEISQSGDSAILYQIQSDTGGAVYGPYRRSNAAKRNAYKLCLVGKKVVEAVKAFGILPRKTFTAQIPPVPSMFWPHFFRGVVDGDGSLSLGGATRERRLAGKVGLCLTIGSACKKFRDGLADAVSYFTDIAGSRIECRKRDRRPEYRLAFSWGSALIVAEWMYREKEKSFWLPRKFRVFEQTRKKFGSI